MTEEAFGKALDDLAKEPTEEDIQRRWHESKKTALWRAKEAAEHNQSYRKFAVGAAVLAYKSGEGPDTRWGFFTGANMKVSEGSPKICAEMTAVMAALQAGYDRIVGIAIVGEPQADHGSGIVSQTLHPCEACRVGFKAIPAIRPDTNLLLGKPTGEDSFALEEMTVEELQKIHKA